MGKVVLVTGVSRLVGGLTSQALASTPGIDKVLAVDSVPPRTPLGGARFVRADIRNPIIGRIIETEKVDTVVHLGVILTPRQVGGRVSQKEINVMGTMQLLAACQRSESLQRLVVKSSTAIYGASSKDPAVFTEEQSARRIAHGFPHDNVDVESYVRGFARRRPDVQTLTLRMANVIGRGLRTSISDLFRLPVVPLPLGFDGRFQVLHLDDAIAVLERAVAASSVHGTINVAGEGVITMRQATRLAGKPFVPILPQAAALVSQSLAASGVGGFDPHLMPLMQFGRAVDTTRMRKELKFKPLHTTRDAFEQVFAPVRTGLGQGK